MKNKVDDFIPLNKTSQKFVTTFGLKPYQHKENNKFFNKVYHSLNDGGIWSNTDGDSLIKDESRNGWVVG